MRNEEKKKEVDGFFKTMLAENVRNVNKSIQEREQSQKLTTAEEEVRLLRTENMHQNERIIHFMNEI